jgi:hypothetical protein
MTGGERAFLALAIGDVVIVIIVIAYVGNLTCD